MNVIDHVKALDFLEINANDRIFLYIKNNDNIKTVNIKEVLDDFILFINEIVRTTHFKMTVMKLHYLKFN